MELLEAIEAVLELARENIPEEPKHRCLCDPCVALDTELEEERKRLLDACNEVQDFTVSHFWHD